MGIPRLLTHLQPYASPITIEQNLNNNNNNNNDDNPPSPLAASNPNTNTNANHVNINIIIDGPAFAYHIYHLCKGHLYYQLARARAEARKVRVRAKVKERGKSAVGAAAGAASAGMAGAFNGNASQQQQQQQHRQDRGGMIDSGGELDAINISALDVVPSYALLNAMARYWLGVLEEVVGVGRVIAIIFDGALPTSKQNVRKARLQNCVNQLMSFRSKHADWSKFPNTAKSRNYYSNANLDDRKKNQGSHSRDQDSDFGFDLDALAARPLPVKLNELPAPPFLVSAIAEGLLRDRNSKHADITYFVPGEADGFCAALAREHVRIEGHGRPLVLTSDSDLLVHDLAGDNSSIGSSSGSSNDAVQTAVVMFFRSISFNKSNDKGVTALKGIQFNPSEISSCLVGPIIKIAFAVSQRPGSSLQENINYARSVCDHSTAFRTFAEPYTATRPLLSTKGFRYKPICGSSVEALDFEGFVVDARVSELFCQNLLLEQNHPQSKVTTQESDNTLKMYLPSLYEDPQRSSAWDCGESIRVVAYSIIGGRNHKSNQVIEHCRRGARIVEKAIEGLNIDQIISSLQEIAQNLREWRESFTVLNDSFRLRLYGVFAVCKFLLQNERPMPSEEEIQSIFRGHFLDKSWEFLHLSAQVQASLYSLRLLRQVLEIWLHLSKASETDNQIQFPVNVMKDAAKELKSLPTIENVFSLNTDHNEDNWCNVKNEFYEMLGCKEALVKEIPNTKSRIISQSSETDICTVHPSIKLVNAYNLLSIQ